MAKEPSMKRKFGSLLRQYRLKANLTQKDLASLIGTTASSISRWERGSRYPPHPEMLHSLADALHLGSLEKARLLETAGFFAIEGHVAHPVLSSVSAIFEDDSLTEKERQVVADFINNFVDRFVSAHRARLLLESGSISEAEQLCENLLVDELDLGRYLRGVVCAILARIRYIQGNLLEAMRLFEVAWSDAPRLDDWELSYFIVTGMGDVLRTQGNWEEAVGYYFRALEMASARENQLAQVKSQRKLATTLLLQHRWPEALPYCEKCLELVQDSDDKVLLAKTLSTIAWGNLQSGDWEVAIEQYREALDLLEKEGDAIQLCTCMTYFAESVQYAGRPDEAIQICEEALRFSEEIGIERERGQVLSKLAALIRFIGGPEEALRLFETAQMLLDRSGNYHALANNYLEMGKAYEDQRETVNARKCYQLAQKLFSQVQDSYGVVSSLYNLAKLANTEARYEAAREAIETGIELSRRAGFHDHLARLCLLLGQLAISKSEFKQAAELLTQACLESTLQSSYTLGETSGQIIDYVQSLETRGQRIEALMLTHQLLSYWEAHEDLPRPAPEQLKILRERETEYERIISLQSQREES